MIDKYVNIYRHRWRGSLKSQVQRLANPARSNSLAIASSGVSQPSVSRGRPLSSFGDVVELGLREARKIHAPRQELALRGRMRIGKPDIEIQSPGELDITGHFGSTVIGQTLAHEGRQLLHLAREAFERILGRAAVHAATGDRSARR